MNERLGHYEIVEELGRGGMGVVYKGYESSLGRYVAIKVLAAAMAHDPVFVERFLREARAMAALNDPHIIQIYFIGQDEDQTFFVMEFIDGESLSDWIKRDHRLPASDALKILMDAAQGLATAHSQGVIHRDIKPGNIMITTRGVVKVADFGIALASNDVSQKLTNTGALVGTPGYLSPEVCLGKPVDQRSDIFALGIVLFEMLTGRMPFNSESPLKLMLDVVEADIPDIREINPDIDEEVTRILGRMLAKNPVDRYQSCDELIADLKKHPLVMQGGPLQLRPWTASDASKSTMVGVPTPITRDTRPPRMATPPPQVGARTQPSAAGHTPAAATVQTLPPTPSAAPPPARSKALPIAAAAVVVLAALGWGIYNFGIRGQPEAPVPLATPAAPAPPPAIVPAATPISTVAADPAAVDAAGATTTAAAVTSAQAPAPAANTATAADPIAEPAVRDSAAEELEREATRRRKLAAALRAAREREAAAADDSSDSGDSSSEDGSDDSGGQRLSPAEARRRYLCRVQRKC